MRTLDDGNLYLIVGIRGGWEPGWLPLPAGIEGTLRHALDERWGISPPWGVCDSGADLESPGNDALRAWVHVDLGGNIITGASDDIPISGLLRTTWDTLEIFGKTTLTGVDAIVPLACGGDRLWHRVAGSILRSRDVGSAERPQVLVQFGGAWPTKRGTGWDATAALETLMELVDVRPVLEGVERAAYPPAAKPDPFLPARAARLQARVTLPAWTIDDAGWLLEAVSISCRRAGATHEVQIAVGLPPKGGE